MVCATSFLAIVDFMHKSMLRFLVRPAAAKSGSVGLPEAACPSTTDSTLPGSGRLERIGSCSSCYVVARQLNHATFG